jgi:ubiquinone/menaquinone biosynthesis C-methylase UbiE
LVKILLLLLGLFLLWQILVRIIRKLFHFPAPAFIGRLLDSNYRRALQAPDKLIQRSGIREGMQVLDLGCGSGAFTTFVAREVGPKGQVYALDIQPKMLEQLKQKLSEPENQDINNAQLINSSAYDLPFKDNSLDLVYTVTVLQEIPDKNRALDEIRRVLKPGGILAVTELLPDPDYVFKSTTAKLCQKGGFVLDEVSGNLWNYTARFRKP